MKPGERLRQLRKARGLSGTQLADLIGISSQYLYEIERVEKRLNDELINRLMRVLNVDANTLLALDESSPAPGWLERCTPPTEMELDEFLKNTRLYFNGAQLDKQDIEDIKAYLRAKWAMRGK